MIVAAGNQSVWWSIMIVATGNESVWWSTIIVAVGNESVYYALNKILNSDWLNTNLTLVDVLLEESNVRQRNLMSGW